MIQLIQSVAFFIRNLKPEFKFRIVSSYILITVILLLFVLSACRNTDNDTLEQSKSAAIQDSVRTAAVKIEKDISSEGPKAWLKHFDHSSRFFMVSDGKLVFPNYDSAAVFVNNFAEHIRSIQLKWSNINIQPLTGNLAVMGADFNEAITDTSGRQMPVHGYCTALFEHQNTGWKLRNLHWSTGGMSL